MKKDDQTLGRMDRKKIEMRSKIINTAIQLIQSNGFEATTMEQIAHEADIAKGTLYNYYPVKEAIISDFIRKTFEQKNVFRLAQIKELAGTRARMIYIINHLMDGVKLQKEIFEKYLVYIMKQVVSFHKGEGAESGIGALVRMILDLGRQEGDISEAFPADMLEDFFIFVFIEVAKQFYLNPEGFQQNEMVEKSVDLFLSGVKPVVQ